MLSRGQETKLLNTLRNKRSGRMNPQEDKAVELGIRVQIEQSVDEITLLMIHTSR